MLSKMSCSKIVSFVIFFCVIYINFLFGHSSSDDDLKNNTTSNNNEPVSRRLELLSKVLECEMCPTFSIRG